MTKRVLVRIEEAAEVSQAEMLPGTGALPNAGTAPVGYQWAVGERPADNRSVLAPPQTLGSGELSELKRSLGELEYELWLLVPGARVVTTELDVTRKEQRHLRSMAPFLLEDDLACEIDDVHFAFGPVSDGKVTLARVEKAWLQQHFSAFAEAGLEIQRCLPEPLLLPTDVNGWSLYLTDELLICQGPGLGLAIDSQLASTVLNTLVHHPSMVPDDNEEAAASVPLRTIALYADTEARLDELESLLPQSLRANINQREVRSRWQFDASLRNVIDLCQGDFTRQLPLERWWQLWSRTAILAAVVLAAFFIISFVEIQMLKSEQQQLRKAMETVYRQVEPAGTLVDPEKQLQRRAQNSLGGSQQSHLMPMLATVTPLIASVDGVQLSTLNYNDDKSELRLNIQAPAFTVIEQLRQSLNQAGLEATLVNASASGDVHQARLRIVGR